MSKPEPCGTLLICGGTNWDMIGKKETPKSGGTKYILNTAQFKHWKTSFEKNFFCVGEYAEYGFDHQRLIRYCTVFLSPVEYGV